MVRVERNWVVCVGLVACTWVGCASGPLPKQAKVYNQRGARALAEGRLDDAEASFRLALEYHPRFAEPRANLGVVALQRGHLEEAERHLRGAIRLNEDFALAWSSLGVVLERQGRLEEARSCYERALSIDPGLRNARRNLAVLLLRMGHFEAARAHWLRLAQIRPRDPDVLGWLAYTELRLGRLDSAMERAEAALELDERAARGRLVRGLVHARRGEMAEALEDLEVAAQDPGLGRDAQVRLAAVLLVAGKVEEATPVVRRLLRLAPGDAAVRFVAAWAALLRGNAAEARRHAEATLSAAPHHRQAKAVLALACDAQGDRSCVRRAGFEALAEAEASSPEHEQALAALRRELGVTQ